MPDAAAEVLLRDRLLASDPEAWKSFQAVYGRLISSAIVRVVGRFGLRAGSDDVREIEASLSVELLQNDKAKLRAFDPHPRRPLRNLDGDAGVPRGIRFPPATAARASR